MNLYQQQGHKQRLVKKAMVSTDDVKIGPGENYINWIPISRDKLQVTFVLYIVYVLMCICWIL